MFLKNISYIAVLFSFIACSPKAVTQTAGQKSSEVFSFELHPLSPGILAVSGDLEVTRSEFDLSADGKERSDFFNEMLVGETVRQFVSRDEVKLVTFYFPKPEKDLAQIFKNFKLDKNFINYLNFSKDQVKEGVLCNINGRDITLADYRKSSGVWLAIELDRAGAAINFVKKKFSNLTKAGKVIFQWELPADMKSSQAKFSKKLMDKFPEFKKD